MYRPFLPASTSIFAVTYLRPYVQWYASSRKRISHEQDTPRQESGLAVDRRLKSQPAGDFDSERAGTLSIVFIISYLALGVPAVAAGFLLAQHVNIIAVAQIFCAVIMAIAGASLAAAPFAISGRSRYIILQH